MRDVLRYLDQHATAFDAVLKASLSGFDNQAVNAIDLACKLG